MISFARQMKEFTLGPFNPSVNVFQWLEAFLKNHIPDNAHQLANGRLAVAVTRMVDRKLTIISSFDSKEDVINVSWFQKINKSPFTSRWFKATKTINNGGWPFFPSTLSAGFTVQLLCTRVLRYDASILQRRGGYSSESLNQWLPTGGSQDPHFSPYNEVATQIYSTKIKS